MFQWWAKGSREQVKNQQSCILVFVAYPTIPSSNSDHQHRQQYSMHEDLEKETS